MSGDKDLDIVRINDITEPMSKYDLAYLSDIEGKEEGPKY